MAKYIIDIPDDRICDYVGSTHLLIPYTMAGHKRLQNTELELQPYTEPDRKAIEAEVWALVRVIADLDGDDYGIVFGEDDRDGQFFELSYQEAKAKYEAWKKEKEEIHVGDEVEDNDGTRGIVFDIIGTDLLGVCWEEERVSHFFWPKGYCRKTGRHFSEAERLLEALKTK